MIVVIADDLTGAAELGGLALRYNLVTEITNRVNPDSTADLLIIATDTRSSSKKDAERITQELCDDLQRLQPRLIFKKIDSVLRGHVLAEINVQKEQLNFKRALIVAGNPGLGRTIIDGVYLLNERPVHLSSFSDDPEFPIRSSAVHKMLHCEKGEISMLKNYETMPETGIVVGDVQDDNDLAAWCRKIDGNTLIAGAAEFFSAILKYFNIKHAPKAKDTATLQLPALMICGSSFRKNDGFVNKMQQEGMPVSYIPEEVVNNATDNNSVFQKWIDETIQYLKQFGKAIIAVDPAMQRTDIDALKLRTTMAEATASIAAHVEINECLIEGGSTSASIMRTLGIDTLYPIQELAPGVIRMGVKGKKDLHITLKPGSYDWPFNILHPEMVKGFYEIECMVF